jgi:hypothetical protein
MGRPSEFPVKKLIAITPEVAKAIEDYRFANRMKTEAEAIRRLIEAGLGAIGKHGGPPSGSSTPSSARKPARKPATPRAKKPTASDRQASPAQSKEAHIRALRELGG